MSLINEEINRIKNIMGLITESVSLPITLTGSYQAPKGDGDALHSFDRRKSDLFGGYMLTGGPIPEKYSSRVTLDQGKGVNQVLSELIKQGVKPDVTNISIKVNNDYTVQWSVTIDESKDGKAYAGVTSRGSAGGGASERALGQIGPLKTNNPNFCNWTQVLYFTTDTPIRIRQYFLKYTICNPDEKPNDIKVDGGSVSDDATKIGCRPSSSFTESPTFDQVMSGNTTIQLKNMGEPVKQIQTILQKLNYDLGKCGIDGLFGRKTKAAIEKFQKEQSINVTSSVDKATLEKLLKQK
jgi:hypothetical protein